MEMLGIYGTSKRGKPTIIFNGYEYCKHRTKTDGRLVWRCSKCRSLKCKATILTVGLQILEDYNAGHNHEVNAAEALARKAVGEMKERMADPAKAPGAVMASVSSALNQRVLMALPKRASLNRQLRRHRHKLTTVGVKG